MTPSLHRPLAQTHTSTWRKLFGVALTIPLCCACLCWRGNDKVSEDEKILTQEDNASRKAHITYTRTNDYRKQSADQWYKDSFRTTIERFDLHTDAPSDRPAHVSDRLLDHQSNRKGEIHFPEPGAELAIAPDGERIAYKLAHESTWKLLFLVDREWLLASEGMLKGKPAQDWSDVPTFEQVAFQLYLDHDDAGPLGQSLLGKQNILRHILATQGEEALSKFILKMFDAPASASISNYHTEQAIALLSERGRVTLADVLLATIKEELDQGRLSGQRVDLLLELRPVSDPSVAPLSAKLTDAFILRAQREDLIYTRAFSSLLLQAAREDLPAGHKLACRMLTRYASDLAKPGKEGRFLRIASLTVIAKSGTSCPIVTAMFHPDEGENWSEFGYINPATKSLYTREELEPIVEQEFSSGPPKTAYHRTGVDGQFILAALLMTGQKLPR